MREVNTYAHHKDWPEDYEYAPSLFRVHATKDVEVECWRSILIFHQAQAYDGDKKEQDLANVRLHAERVTVTVEGSRLALAKHLVDNHQNDVKEAAQRRKGAPRIRPQNSGRLWPECQAPPRPRPPVSFALPQSGRLQKTHP